MNNGFIDIVPSEDAVPLGPSVDEVFIAGTRYRVPERIVLLDFWDRCKSVALPDTKRLGSKLLTSCVIAGVSLLLNRRRRHKTSLTRFR